MERVVNALYTDETVTVYQAFAHNVGHAALAAQKFVPPFKLDRMTWIKPSFLWMMHRSGWASKPNQQTVLAVEVLRNGFDWALANACLTTYNAAIHQSREHWATCLEASPARIQWDPDRSVTFDKLARKAIQVGLAGRAAVLYATQWVVGIQDWTRKAHQIADCVHRGDLATAESLLPKEVPYPVGEKVARSIGVSTLNPRP